MGEKDAYTLHTGVGPLKVNNSKDHVQEEVIK